MICRVCAGPLFADRQSIEEAAYYGYKGGRVRCLLGCTDTWLLERPAEPVDLTPSRKEPRINGAHQHPRKVRVALCQAVMCNRYFETTASVVKFCPSCRVVIHAARERERGRMRRKVGA